MRATLAAALVFACALPGLASAQGRPLGVSVPQVPAVAHPPQLPAAPVLPHAPPSVPTVAALPAPATTRLFAIPPAAALHLPGFFHPPTAALATLTHGPAAAALNRGRPDVSAAPGSGSSGPDAARLQRHAGLAKAAPDVFELDRCGELVLRGQVLATGADQRALAAAAGLGFQFVERQSLSGVGLKLAVLRAPSALTVDEAIARLKAAIPEGVFEPNPVYDTVASAPPAPTSAPPAARRADKPIDIGVIDTGVEAGHAALAGSRIVQQGFSAGGPRPGGHGTAVASLIAGETGSYRGVAPRSTIYVADVYGAGPGGGSAAAVAQAIDWLVRQKAPVINISLVGPANRLLEKAIQGAVARGAVVVAAVGNDGPFSPPLYPAAYRDVVAVTGVDRRDAILAEAVRSTPVAFAAPGADISAAHLGGGFEQVRGTSFAAPIVAAEIAMAHRRMDRADAVRALLELQKKAVKAPGAGSAAYGWGLVGDDLRPGLAAGARDALAEK